jgi:hypothetical protein
MRCGLGGKRPPGSYQSSPGWEFGRGSGTSYRSQLWRGSLLSGSSTRYTIVNAHSGKCVGTKSSGITANTPIVRGACYTGADSTQIWQAVDFWKGRRTARRNQAGPTCRPRRRRQWGARAVATGTNLQQTGEVPSAQLAPGDDLGAARGRRIPALRLRGRELLVDGKAWGILGFLCYPPSTGR